MKKIDIPAGVEFRPVGTGDEKIINEFFDAMGGESRALFNRRDFNRRGVLKHCLHPDDETRRYWIAEIDGEMIGYVFFLDFNTSIPALGLALRDDMRGKHLGRALVDFAIRTAKETGKGGIQLTTHVANVRGQALYEAMGFTLVGPCKNGTEFFYLYRFNEN